MHHAFARDTLDQGGAVQYGPHEVRVEMRSGVGASKLYVVLYDHAPMEAYPTKREAIDNALLALEYPE